MCVPSLLLTVVVSIRCVSAWGIFLAFFTNLHLINISKMFFFSSHTTYMSVQHIIKQQGTYTYTTQKLNMI